MPSVLSSVLTSGRGHSVILWCVFYVLYFVITNDILFFFSFLFEYVTISLNAFDIALLFLLQVALKSMSL